jgi:hypothetical protein
MNTQLNTKSLSPQQVWQTIDINTGLRMAEVGEVVELVGAELDDRTAGDERRWLLTQARRQIQIGEGAPTHVIAFSVWPGEECKVANLGLATYPEVMEAEDGEVATGLNGWMWHSFCKNQFSSNPSVGGTANFVRCHLAVINLLDAVKAIGILEEVKDEGYFWENRDVKALVETVGRWNSRLAGLAGLIKDEFPGQIVAAPITEFPNFEHLLCGQDGYVASEPSVLGKQGVAAGLDAT